MNETAPIVVTEGPAAEPAFIPVSRTDIIAVILDAGRWANDNERKVAEAVLTKIGSLRQHKSAVMLNELGDLYDAFNPDDETINQSENSEAEKLEKRRVFNDTLRELVTSANYKELTDQALADVLSNASPDGVHVEVDFSEFDMKLIFFRGEDEQHRSRRDMRWAYLRREHYTVPTYKRLFMAVKFKPEDDRVAELMGQYGIDEKKARRKLKSIRKTLPPAVSTDHIYLKIFKDIPRYDVEMLFPNIRVKMKYQDKLQLGGSALAGTLTWAIGTAAKFALVVAVSPLLFGGALVTGFGTILYAQVRNIFITRDRYRMQLAQSLYFQNLANNQGALAVMVDDAEEEDVKEEILLFSHLLGHTVHVSQLEALQVNISNFLRERFKAEVRFDIHDALKRLVALGLVSQSHGGELRTLSLTEANTHLYGRWCRALEG